MNGGLLTVLLVVSTVVGYRLLKEVPALLHTPLMSGMNALSGITILGALLALGVAAGTGNRWAAAIAVFVAAINVVGGYLVTHRMLRMFDRKG